MKRLTILTISGRHALLPSVGASVFGSQVPQDVDLRWLVKLNPQLPLPWATHIAIWDEAIRSLSNTWVLLLSDDNLLHPNVVCRWREIIEYNQEARVIHVDQQFGIAKVRYAGSDHLGGGKCDGGQFLFDADFYNRFEFSYAQFGFEGELFKKFHETNPGAFYFHNEILAYHDRLRW